MDNPAATTAGGMIIGTVLTIAVNAILSFTKDYREDKARAKTQAAEAARAERIDGREDMREVLDRTVTQLNEVRKELKDCHAEHEETRQRCSSTERGFARAVAWIEALQYRLDDAGLRYPKFVADPMTDSAVAPALQQTPAPTDHPTPPPEVKK